MKNARAQKVYHLAIEMKNAAFEENPCGEVARILRELADKVEAEEPIENHTFHDINGNYCGNAWIEWEA
jgi:hypothetical protein